MNSTGSWANRRHQSGWEMQTSPADRREDKMEVACSFETIVYSHNIRRHNNPDDHNIGSYPRENLKS
jgi:hypothetical protein